MDKKYMNQSILRALEIMEQFSTEDPSLGLKDVSERVGLHKSTAHRLLTTLESRGWLIREPEDGRYRPGIRLLTIAQLVDESITSVRTVRPILKHLAETVSELTVLSMWDGEDVICVDKVDDSRRSLRVTSAIGRVHPLHAGATGFAVLLAMPEDEARKILQNRERKAYTEKTETDLERLMDAYRRLRKQGYVISTGQVDREVTAIAVPLWFPYEKTCGSIGVTIPESQTTDSLVAKILSSLQEAARQIQDSLGSR